MNPRNLHLVALVAHLPNGAEVPIDVERIVDWNPQMRAVAWMDLASGRLHQIHGAVFSAELEERQVVRPT